MFPCEVWSPCGSRGECQAQRLPHESHSNTCIQVLCSPFPEGESLHASCPLEVQSFQPACTKTQSSGASVDDYRSVPDTPVIPMLCVGSRTNRWSAHSQINTNLLSICYVSFWHVPGQGAKRNTSQSWEALPAHRVPRAGASAALSIQAKITEPDFPQMLCTFPSSQCQPHGTLAVYTASWWKTQMQKVALVALKYARKECRVSILQWGKARWSEDITHTNTMQQVNGKTGTGF